MTEDEYMTFVQCAHLMKVCCIIEFLHSFHDIQQQARYQSMWRDN